MLPRQRDRRDDIIDVARQNYSDRNLAIVGAVSGVEGAAAGIEADFTAEVGAQSALQGDRIHSGIPGGARDFYKVRRHSPGLVVGIVVVDHFSRNFGNMNSGLAILWLNIDGQHVLLVG